MSNARRHPHDLYDLPTLRLLLEKGARASSGDHDYRGKQQGIAHAEQRPMPGAWKAGIEVGKAKRDRREGNHRPRGAASLPVASEEEIAEADRRCVECDCAMPPDCRSDAQRCSESCKKAGKAGKAREIG